MLAVVLVATIVISVGALNIKTEFSWEDMLPKKLDSVRAMKLMRAEMGRGDVLIIVFQLDKSAPEGSLMDLFDPRVLETMKYLEDKLRDQGFVRDIASPLDIIERAYGGLPEDRKTLMRLIDETSARNFFSEDGETAVMFVYADIGTKSLSIENAQDVVEEYIQLAPKPPGLRVVLTGSVTLTNRIVSMIFSSLLETSLLALLIVAILAVLFFKSLEGILPVVSLLFAVLWTAGIMGWMNLTINTASAGFGAMLIAIGIAYSIHIMNRYREERARGAGQREAMDLALGETGVAVLATSATTMAGFFALTFGSVSIMRQLGFILLIGIFSSFLSSVIVLPSMLVLLERMRGERMINAGGAG